MKRRVRDVERGFTLIEVLTVVVLLSLLAGLLTVRLSATSVSASFHSLEARLKDLDGRARLFARSSGPVVLSISRDKGSVELRNATGGEVLIRIASENDTDLELEMEPAGNWLLFDGRGLTRDYSFAIARGPQRARWRVSGATGWIESLADEEDE